MNFNFGPINFIVKVIEIITKDFHLLEILEDFQNLDC